MSATDPFQPADQAARDRARQLVGDATHAALAVIRPGTGWPSVSRIALATEAGGGLVSLISDLAPHTAALAAEPACALLIGEPGTRGDPLTHPRLTLHCTARILPRDAAEHARIRARYLEQRPKARLYADFADFRFVRFTVNDAMMNGGFGRAYRLTADDLLPG